MRFSFLLVFLFSLSSLSVYGSRPEAPSNLRTCDKVQPAGTEADPFFGWHINDPDDNEIQTAYQVLVATSEKLLKNGHADIWDSGKTSSRQQNYVYFDGKALSAGTRYYWKVRTWDKGGKVSPYSVTTYFDVGLSKAADWNGAMWIKRDTKDANDKGDIEVEWNRDSKIYRLTLTVPDNVIAEVYIPKEDSSSITVKVDGKPVAAKETGNFLLIENVGSGTHVFEKELQSN